MKRVACDDGQQWIINNANHELLQIVPEDGDLENEPFIPEIDQLGGFYRRPFPRGQAPVSVDKQADGPCPRSQSLRMLIW